MHSGTGQNHTQVLPRRLNYVMSDTAMMGMLLSALAQAESGVSRQLTDMMGMAEIFSAAEALGFTVPHAELNLSDMSPAGFEMHEVNRLHDQMTLALIELHGQIEQDANHDLNEQIWRYLSAMHDRPRSRFSWVSRRSESLALCN